MESLGAVAGAYRRKPLFFYLLRITTHFCSKYIQHKMRIRAITVFLFCLAISVHNNASYNQEINQRKGEKKTAKKVKNKIKRSIFAYCV